MVDGLFRRREKRLQRRIPARRLDVSQPICLFQLFSVFFDPAETERPRRSDNERPTVPLLVGKRDKCLIIAQMTRFQRAEQLRIGMIFDFQQRKKPVFWFAVTAVLCKHDDVFQTALSDRLPQRDRIGNSSVQIGTAVDDDGVGEQRQQTRRADTVDILFQIANREVFRFSGFTVCDACLKNGSATQERRVVNRVKSIGNFVVHQFGAEQVTARQQAVQTAITPVVQIIRRDRESAATLAGKIAARMAGPGRNAEASGKSYSFIKKKIEYAGSENAAHAAAL